MVGFGFFNYLQEGRESGMRKSSHGLRSTNIAQPETICNLSSPALKNITKSAEISGMILLSCFGA